MACNALNISNYLNFTDPATNHTFTSSCDYVLANCGDEWDYLNFLGLYYCELNQNVPIIIVVSIAFVAFAFNFLGTTADAYLAPTLETISDKLKLSDAIAGVTLLALANGASDVIAGIVAGGKPTGGLTIAIGGLFGACFFTTSIVLARCIQGGGDIKVDHEGMKRDVAFLLIGSLYFVVCLSLEEINVPLASGFFAIYVVFIILVICQERHKAHVKEQVTKKIGNIKAKLLPKTAAKVNTMWDRMVAVYMAKRILKKKLMRGKTIKVDFNFDDPQSEEEEEEDNSCFGKTVRLYNKPLLFLRDLTMPPFESENWNVWKAAVTPYFGFLFLLWQIGELVPNWESPLFWVIYGVVATVFSLIIIVAGKNKDLTETHGGILATVTFIGAALWINMIANFFMDFLSLISVISGLPLNFLSLTLLAWGNSLDDFFVDYVIAKNGHGKMAVTGVYGGQIFNLFIGFGGATFRQTMKYGPQALDVFDLNSGNHEQDKANLLTMILMVSNIVGLGLTLIVAKSQGWMLGKNMMKFLMILYGTFLITVSVISIF